MSDWPKIEQFKEWRKDNRLTQEKAAGLFNVTHSTVAKWETGRRSFGGGAAVLLALYLHRPAD